MTQHACHALLCRHAVCHNLTLLAQKNIQHIRFICVCLIAADDRPAHVTWRWWTSFAIASAAWVLVDPEPYIMTGGRRDGPRDIAAMNAPRNMSAYGAVKPLYPIRDLWQARPARATWRWWTSCATASAAWCATTRRAASTACARWPTLRTSTAATTRRRGGRRAASYFATYRLGDDRSRIGGAAQKHMPKMP